MAGWPEVYSDDRLVNRDFTKVQIMPENRYPRYIYNKLTIIGGILAACSFSLIIFFLFFLSGLGHTNPYLGVFAYMVLPPVFILGFVLMPMGVFRRWRKIKQFGDSAVPDLPYLDFGKKTHRNLVTVLFFGSLLFVSVIIFVGYQAFHHTESVEFCGETCHPVMKPEHVAYGNSSHARVPCTACHVGEGAGWYAKSKLAGLYQVWAVTADIFPRPIPTPIHNLRPAQETCEKCHWPEKFYGGQQRQFNHYMYDEGNTAWSINLLIKTGGGDPQTGQTAGIHWHMNIGVKVEYIARDERRQDIPWIKVTDRRTGRVTVYQDTEDPLSAEEIEAAELRHMDCMDCHNRPSHKFQSPDHMIDLAILTGQIDRTLPGIKKIAVEAMAQDYEANSNALQSIASRLLDEYSKKYPGVYKEHRQDIETAVISTQRQFSKSIFPEMKARWDQYPDNIGHFIYPGCMRCHDGNKVSVEGWTIQRDCSLCHSILAQGSGESAQMASVMDGLEFVHPEDIDEEWLETGCYECHSGTQP